MNLYGYIVSSKNRIKILKSMSIEEPRKSKEIAKQASLSWQTASAELTNLNKYGVVMKESSGYTLTEKGFFLITRISYLPDFNGWNLDDFVSVHQIHRIPKTILKDFGIWEKISFKEFIPTDYLATEKDSITKCTRQYRIITPYIIKIDISLIQHKLDEIPFKFIYSKQGLEQEGALEYLNEQKEKGIQIRLVDIEDMYLTGRILDVHEAHISFRLANGDFDFTHYIVGDDEEFVFWCRRNFHYLWEKGIPY